MRVGHFHTSYEARWERLAFTTDRVVVALCLLGAVTLPWWAGEYWLHLLTTAAITSLGAIGMVLLEGYTGQVSLGANAFLAVGAFATGILAGHLKFLSFPIAVCLSGLLAGVCGLVAAVPSFRLRGLYLALATFAFQDVVILLLTKGGTLTNGAMGMVVRRPTLFGVSMASDTNFYYLTLTILALVVLGVSNLVRGQFGRSWLAIKDRESAAAAMGLNVRRLKSLSFFASSVLLGLGGCLYAYYVGYVVPENFDILMGVEYIAMVVVGGGGSFVGGVLGAVFFTLLPQIVNMARPAMEAAVGANALQVLPFLQQLVYALLVVAFIVYQPEGLYGWWRSLRRFLEFWPFRS